MIDRDPIPNAVIDDPQWREQEGYYIIRQGAGVLSEINGLAARWHELMVALAASDEDRRAGVRMRTLEEIEEELESAWERRRRWLARSYVRTLSAVVLVDRFSRDERDRPLCVEMISD